MTLQSGELFKVALEDPLKQLRRTLDEPLVQIQDLINEFNKVTLEFDFNPNPEQTWQILNQYYSIRKNIIVR
jgi:hypothetical protein